MSVLPIFQFLLPTVSSCAVSSAGEGNSPIGEEDRPGIGYRTTKVQEFVQITHIIVFFLSLCYRLPFMTA